MYNILLQRDDKALGVLPRIFESTVAIDEYVDSKYPDCFYSQEFSGSATVRKWVAKYGYFEESV